MIACRRLPFFAAVLAQRDESRLQGMPSVLVGERGRVARLSPEAAASGVRAGMPLRRAQMLNAFAHAAGTFSGTGGSISARVL